jgi:hypothetical protein
VGRWGRPSTARRSPDRTQFIWGMCLITDFRTAGCRKFKFGGQEGETRLLHGARRIGPKLFGEMCLITDFRTAGRRKFKFGGQEEETDYCTAHAGSDPNYLGKASIEDNAVVRCEFGHVGDGRQAAGGLKYQVSWCI